MRNHLRVGTLGGSISNKKTSNKKKTITPEVASSVLDGR